MYQSQTTYLTSHVGGYTEAEFVSHVLTRNTTSSRRVYSINAESLDFFFAENDITAIGDWFGPERYSDLVVEIDRGNAVRHLQRFDVDAVIVPSTAMGVAGDEQRKLFAELTRGGFHLVILPNSIYHLFFAPKIVIAS